MPAVLDRPTEIKPATKQEFIEALRSGKYEQCRGSMFGGGNRFCAIAVYHVISGDDTFNALVGANQILGIPINVYAKIFNLNDANKTFEELANIFALHLKEDFSSLDY